MENSMDLSSVVSLIMKHPELIEQIAALAKSEGDGGASGASVEVPATAEPVSETSRSQGERDNGGTHEISKSENRKRLFSAIRPFLSDERARTLSSVEAVVSILDSMHS